MTSSKLLYWVALAQVGRIGRKTASHLEEHFGELSAIFRAPTDELLKVSGVGEKTAAKIRAVDLSRTQKLIEHCQRANISIVSIDSPQFPKRLFALPDAPIVLFHQGGLNHPLENTVAIVGTRMPTTERVAYTVTLAQSLAATGWSVISGLALGIDTAAHAGALRAEGHTVAVLGNGLQRIYPRQNEGLAYKIAQTGTLVSEYPPYTQVSPSSLRARNRITSGLSDVVIVVQATKDSGSLATAALARKQGRAVFAVDGDDEGCQQLIAGGASILPFKNADLSAISERLLLAKK